MLASTTGKTQKPIAIKNGSSGTVMYTVPTNKTFRGYYYHDDNGGTFTRINVNAGTGVQCQITANANWIPVPVNLAAGSIVTAVTSNYGSLIGIEE